MPLDEHEQAEAPTLKRQIVTKLQIANSRISELEREGRDASALGSREGKDTFKQCLISQGDILRVLAGSLRHLTDGLLDESLKETVVLELKNISDSAVASMQGANLQTIPFILINRESTIGGPNRLERLIGLLEE